MIEMQSVTDRVITQSMCLTSEQITKLQKLSRETGKSLSSLAREAVDAFLHHKD
jgi:predicted DNA-binding protein